jgi:hypothetical protein
MSVYGADVLACSIDESRAEGEEEIAEITGRMNAGTTDSSDCRMVRKGESHTRRGGEKWDVELHRNI